MYAYVDLDNDGLLDLFIANGHVYPDVARTGTSTYLQRNQVFRNLGKERLRHFIAHERPEAGVSRWVSIVIMRLWIAHACALTPAGPCGGTVEQPASEIPLTRASLRRVRWVIAVS